MYTNDYRRGATNVFLLTILLLDIVKGTTKIVFIKKLYIIFRVDKFRAIKEIGNSSVYFCKIIKIVNLKAF